MMEARQHLQAIPRALSRSRSVSSRWSARARRRLMSAGVQRSIERPRVRVWRRGSRRQLAYAGRWAPNLRTVARPGRRNAGAAASWRSTVRPSVNR